MPEAEAVLYERPFAHVRNHVKPIREIARQDAHRRAWWRCGDARLGPCKALQPLTRYILTSRVVKHRLFVWANKFILPDSRLYNDRPTWLDHAHRDLDEAVAQAYAWKSDISDDGMPTKLLALNLERAKEYAKLCRA
jgi:hypothetical protein